MFNQLKAQMNSGVEYLGQARASVVTGEEAVTAITQAAQKIRGHLDSIGNLVLKISTDRSSLEQSFAQAETLRGQAEQQFAMTAQGSNNVSFDLLLYRMERIKTHLEGLQGASEVLKADAQSVHNAQLALSGTLTALTSGVYGEVVETTAGTSVFQGQLNETGAVATSIEAAILEAQDITTKL